MASSLSGIGTLFVGGVFFTVWIISQIWYIILPIVAVIVGAYLYDKYTKEKFREKQIREQRRAVLQRIAREREEEKRLEEERIRIELERKEQEKVRIIEENKNRVTKRLEQFDLSEPEAQLVFGKSWRKRLEKPDDMFVSQEIIKIWEKLIESPRYKAKVMPIMDKVLDLIDQSMHRWGRYNDWDDIDFENWEEDWQDVKDEWRKQRHYYQDYEDYSKDHTDTADYQKYYEILGLKVGATIKEIKAQFRKLMIKFHPDRNKSPNAEKKCREIIEAYSKLGKIVNN